MVYKHIPVMLKEVIQYLNPRPGENFVDCTLGGAGYALEIAKHILPDGQLIAIDLDELAIKNAQERIRQEKLNNIILVKDNFGNLENIVRENRLKGGAGFSGIVLDLGLSSAHLDDRSRGFSFQFDAPLNMAFGSGENNTEEIVNKWRAKELERILRQYGEEKYAHQIALKISRVRKDEEIKTTGQLIEVIRQAVPPSYTRLKIHFATRAFQALRIATNNEMDNLEKVLPAAVDLLSPSGRLAVISYHSLEDRIVKNFFRQEGRECICPPELPICICAHQPKLKIITRKVLIPGVEEVKNNPRSRSAKMRVAEKI